MGAGYLDLVARDLPAAQDAWERAAKLFEAAGEDHRVRLARFNLGVVASQRGNHGEARKIYERLRGQIHPARAPALFANLADAQRALGEIESGRNNAEESIALSRAAGDERVLASALCTLGKIEMEAGNPAAAQSALAEALRLKLRLGHTIDLYAYLSPLGELGRRRKNWDFAAFFHGAAEAQIEKYHVVPGEETARNHERLCREACEALGESKFEALCRHGAVAGHEQWLDWAAQICDPPRKISRKFERAPA
jgi:tetratricopeptide (TPR) repeat protein